MEIVECYTVRNPGTPQAYIDPKSWSYIKWAREKGISLFRDTPDFMRGHMPDEDKFISYGNFSPTIFITPREILEEHGLFFPTREYVLEKIRSVMDKEGDGMGIIEGEGYRPYTESQIVARQKEFLNFLTSKGIHLS